MAFFTGHKRYIQWCIHRCIPVSLAILLLLLLPVGALCKPFAPDIRPGKGCSGSRLLSELLPGLKGTNLDTRVYYLDSGIPGATALVIGGTHGNEPAGSMAALVLVENSSVKQGRLIVIPHANPSAASILDTRCSIPYRHALDGKSGTRYMYYGDRRTDPADHRWWNGDTRARNLNRVWPGDRQGTPTQQLAYAIFNLIQTENVDFLIDFHEARTRGKGKDKDKYRLANSLVTHPSGLEIGAWALLEMEADTGISLKLEASNANYQGLSHWEIGTRTSCIPFLTESPNPAQDAWRSNPDPVHDKGLPLKHRVGIHLRMLVHLAASHGQITGKPLKIQGIPAYGNLMKQGIGPFLN